MKKSKKQMAIAAAACAMIGVMAIGGTMAYLTDSETATNTFTIGKVQIDLEEPNYPGNDDPAVQNIVPNQVIKKDPQVENTGVNDAIVYLKVEVPKANVITAQANGTREEAAVKELFDLKNLDTTNWVLVDSTTDDNAKATYVYAYKKALAKDTKTEALFDSVQLKNVIEGQIDEATENLKVSAYAIQSTNILEGDADLAETLDETNLKKIYDIYVAQNAGQDEKAADTSNAKDLKGQDRAKGN